MRFNQERLKHMALRNAIYHVARRGWLDGWNRFWSLIIILGGTSVVAVAQIISTHIYFALAQVGIIVFAGAIQLVYDLSGRARQSEILQRRYYTLMSEIEKTNNPTDEQCAEWKAEFSLIAADELPRKRALHAMADNQATAAMYGAKKPRQAVTWWQSATRHVLNHNTATFAPQEDWELDS